DLWSADLVVCFFIFGLLWGKSCLEGGEQVECQCRRGRRHHRADCGLRRGRVGVTILSMYRLLVLLQLTRAALAFTAIADAWTVLLLRPPGVPSGDLGVLIWG